MNTTEIPDLSGTSPQRTFLLSQPQKPTPESTLYIQRFSERHDDGTRSHTVIGVHIVLAKGHANGLWEAFHVDRATQKLDPLNPRVTVRALRICCDTLEVRGQLCIPEAKVEIFARRLVWATPDAALNTTPLDWAVGKAANATDTTPGQNGAQGRNAGAVSIQAGIVEPLADTQVRVLALGGRGQDPGAGRDGVRGASKSSYTSVPFKVKDSGLSESSATVSFDPPAVFIKYDWYWGAIVVASGQKGEDAFPGNGTDALPAGRPGDGGNGGAFTTNVASMQPCVRNTGGAAGAGERNRVGGAAGQPTLSAKYTLWLAHDIFGTTNARHEKKETKRNTTTAGKDASAPPAQRGNGDTPKPVVTGARNAWLHPLSLQRTLEYAREAFLAGARDEVAALIAAYDIAMREDTPQNGAWPDGTQAAWTAAQTEVAAMLQRLRAHLDYFGNGAGFTPLLSLRSSVQLYEQETGRALRTLLLARWIDGKERSAQEAQAALGEAVAVMNAESQQAALQVVEAEAKISSALNRREALEQELSGLSNQLETLRSTLLTKAQNDLQQQAQIKFAIRMAAAVCQVIPVGQPVLGTIGSLAGAAADFVGDDGTGAPDTLSKMSGVLTKAAEAAKKAEEAKKKAQKEKAKNPDGDAASAKASSGAWAQVGKGLGPALSQVSEGVKALQVPASEVEAQLQRLEADSPEWGELTDRIRDVNERKISLFDDLTAGFEALGEGYARISGNAAATFTMQQERERQLGMLDPAATAYVRQMSQRSRLTLLKYLYLMVRSYETTVFRPINVDWNLAEVLDKIVGLVQPGSDYSAAMVQKNAAVLLPIFQANVDTVRRQILDDFVFGEKTITLQLGISALQTPELVGALNDIGVARIDPLTVGLVLPDRQLARMSSVTLRQLELDPSGPPLPDSHNMIITLQPADTGTMRREEQLYSVYSEQPVEWSWTRVAGEVKASVPSRSSEDMMDLVLGPGSEKIRQRVALPPVWSDLFISVRFSPELPAQTRPRVTKLYFQFDCDTSPAPAHQCVLNVQPTGTPGDAITDCTADLAHRASGFDNMVRIFSKGARVRLAAPDHAGSAVFRSWDLIGRQVNRIGVEESVVELTMGDHVLARSRWERARIALEEPVSPAVLDRVAIARMIDEHPQAKEVAAGMMAAASVSMPSDLPIRIAAEENATIVGIAPELAACEIVEEGPDGWLLVNFRGIVGWIRTVIAELATPRAAASGPAARREEEPPLA